MPDQNEPTTTTSGADDVTQASSPVVEPTSVPNPPSNVSDAPIVEPIVPSGTTLPSSDSEIYPEVARKISEAHNILIALSSDPSVDEMAAAIGLSLFLDKLGKRANAIYSGNTPNALEFLRPQDTFDTSADTLQDFVVALSKEKADHLRYKLDGEFVKIYITPYKTRISEEDLDFSYGDFNVDLVLALDVANGIDLDSALREHGRIMHDASIINITTGNPGKFGEIEWSNKKASSVSEMIAKLLYSLDSKEKIGKEESTAFLTGIVAATNRFSNAKTTPDTMKISSRLMESGANQQLISKNITPDVENEYIASADDPDLLEKNEDSEKLDIRHGNEEDVDETKEVETTVTEKESTLLDDLKAAEASLSQAGAETTPDVKVEPIHLSSDSSTPSDTKIVDNTEPETNSTTESILEVEDNPTPEAIAPESTSAPETIVSDPAPTSETITPEPAPTTESTSIEPNYLADTESSPTSPTESITENKDIDEAETNKESNESIGETLERPEKVIQPSEGLSDDLANGGTDKYGKMLEEALVNTPVQTMPTPEISTTENPAMTNAPAVPEAPEINGVPEMNYMPMPGEEILPPPPAPAIDMGATPIPAMAPPAPTPTVETPPVASPAEVAPIQPAMPAPEPTPEPLGNQPAMQDQVYRPQANDPGAFKIPGM